VAVNRPRAAARPVITPGGMAGFRPDIQGLRALAVGLVVIYHLYPSALPGGYVGVDLFFVISGYLITGGLLKTLRRTGRVSLAEFYGRRARRLMPAAALVLVVTWIGSRLILPASQMPAVATQIRASALYFQNWQLAHDAVGYLTANRAASPVQHFWSLSVEEQFYLLWPLLFLVAGYVASRRGHGDPESRARAGRRSMLALAVGVVAASLAYSIHETAANPAAAYYVTTTRMWELGVGGLLSLLSEKVSRRIGRVGLLAWVGLAMIVVSAFVFTGNSAFPGSIALLPVVGGGLLLVCGSQRAKLGTFGLTTRKPLVFIGDISYSIYLWHFPLIVLWKAYSHGSIGLLDGPAIAIASVVLAWCTKICVEDPVRVSRFFARHTWRSLATVSAALVPAVLAATYLTSLPSIAAGARLDADHPGAAVLAGDVPVPPIAAIEPPLTVAYNDFNAASLSPCLDGQTSTKVVTCTFGDTRDPTLKIVLAGDSISAQWGTALQTIAADHHWELITQVHAGCPLTAVPTMLLSNSTTFADCHVWSTAALHNIITTIKPDVVITSDLPESVTPSTAVGTASNRVVARGMEQDWTELIQHGIKVVPIRETPEMGQNIPDCLSASGATVASCSVSASKAIEPVTPITIAADAMRSKVGLITMNSFICAPTTCAPVVGNVLVYRDAHHLTGTYITTLRPYLETALIDAIRRAKK
jgi:peptidoglycan/LPS O-acetylase OafA/YrhL